MSALLRTHTTWNDSRVSIHISLSLFFFYSLSRYDPSIVSCVTCFFRCKRTSDMLFLREHFIAVCRLHNRKVEIRRLAATKVRGPCGYYRSPVERCVHQALLPFRHRVRPPPATLVSPCLPPPSSLSLSLSLSLSPSSAFLLLDGVLYVYVASA